MSVIKKPEKIESNFMVINFNLGYEDGLVLPYKEGIAVLTALENVKVYSKAYSKESQIKDVKHTDIKTSSIGAQEYGEAILRTTLLAEDESK